jgi:CheY-like chemotaxis protein
MPEMDGIEATKEICSLWPKERRPRIIAMTAGAMQGDREKCIEAGMDDYISKPVKVEELQMVLERSTSFRPEPTQINSGGLEILDRNVMDGLRQLQDQSYPNLINDLIDNFLKDATEKVEAIITAFRDRQSEDIVKLAHSLKGSSATLGGRQFSALCAEIEKKMLRNCPLEDLETLFEKLEAEFYKLCQVLKVEKI